MSYDFRCFPRDRSERGRLRFEIDRARGPSVIARAVTADGVPVSCDVERQAGTLTVAIPSGGPYEITLTDPDGEIACARNVLVGDLWVLAGQSNMQGLGENNSDPLGSDRATMLSFDRTWKPAIEPLHRFWETNDTAQYKMTPRLGLGMNRADLDRMFPEMNAADAQEPVGGVGPGAFFASELISLSDVPVGLIPCALGGSSLDMWQRSYPQEQGLPPADTLYRDLIDRIRLAGGHITGVLWYQGESDTLPEWAPSYLERFTRFVNDVRRDTGLPDLPFITVQLGTVEQMEYVGEHNFDLVREAQRRAADTIPNVEGVAAADLPRVDHVHLSRKGQQTLGARLARTATRYTRGCKARFSSPRLEAVTRNGNHIDVSFSDLNGDLRVAPEVSLEQCFEVDGHAVRSARARRSAVVEIELENPSDRADRVSYGTGFGGVVALYDSAGFALPVFDSVPVNEGALS
ncbi:MAG: sialate O-acetylesterase [Actinomycetota bacterium]